MNNDTKGMILIVDETPAPVRVVETILSDAGYQVSVATSRERVPEMVQILTPDLILLDNLIPGIEGDDICRRLKEDELTRSIPIIFLSEKKERSEIMKGFAMGAADYVIKPVAVEDLLMRVQTHLRLRKVEQRLEAQAEILNTEFAEHTRAYEALKAREEKYRLAVEATNDGLWEWDLTCGTAVFSPRYYTMLGYEPGEFPPTFEAWKALLHPDDQEQIIPNLLHQIHDKTEFLHVEFRIRSKTGEWLWIQGRGKVVAFDDTGNATRVIGVNTDISHQKRAEVSLRDSEERYRLLVQNVPDYILVHRNGIILFVNTAAASSFGYSPDELIGSPLMQYLTPQSQKVVAEMMQKRFSGTSLATYEVTILTKNGKQKRTEVHGVLIQYEGEPASLNVLTDVTERKQALENLQESEERYRILAEKAPIGILTCDREGKITYINPRLLELLGSQNIEMTKEINLLAFPSLVDSGFSAILTRVLADGIPAASIDLLYTSIWGKAVYYLGHISPLTREGQVYGAQIILDDITDRKKDEEALVEAIQKLRLLTSLTRHDILNQVATVGLLQDLALSQSDPEKIREYISRAREAGDLIERTIGFTREYENFGIVSSGWQIISLIIDSAREEVALGSVTVLNQIPEDLEIFADPIIRKVFVTLIENSIRHGGDISSIRLSSSDSDEALILSCEDDGIGIAQEEKDLIFDHGYGKNTGIGLFLAREILSITGLSIRECGEPGMGARFEILVPEGKFRIRST